MTLVATFDPTNSRVALVGTVMPAIPGMDVFVERQVGTGDWEGVRSGFPVIVSAGGFTIYDYEFTPNVLNNYRVRTDFVWDDMAPPVANSWGSADAGGAWTFSTGVAADWDKAANVGTYVMTSATGVVSRQSLTVANAVQLDYFATVSQSQTVTGGGLFAQFRARGLTNDIVTRVRFNAAGTVDLFLFEGGVQVGAALAVFSFAAGNSYNVRTRMVGQYYQAKLWQVGTTEPTAWNVSYTSLINPVSGSITVEASRETGNTNVNPVMTFSNFHVANLDTVTPQYSSLGTSSSTPTQNSAWVKFPLRPFLNFQATLCNWSPEVRVARGTVFEVLGRRMPVAVNDVRGSRAFNVIFRAQDSTEAEAIELALSFGDTIYLQTPGPDTVCLLNKRRYPASGYFFVEDVTSTRVVDGRPTQSIDFDVRETDGPDPAVDYATTTWQGIINNFATWSTVQAAFATWLLVQQYQSDPADEIVG